MTELCKKCAECCRHYPFVELTDNDIRTLRRETGMHADAFTNAKGMEAEEYFLQFQRNGDCIFLHEDGQGFSCGVYAARPGICKKYPTGITQQDRCDAISEKILGKASDRNGGRGKRFVQASICRKADGKIKK